MTDPELLGKMAVFLFPHITTRSGLRSCPQLGLFGLFILRQWMGDFMRLIPVFSRISPKNRLPTLRKGQAVINATVGECRHETHLISPAPSSSLPGLSDNPSSRIMSDTAFEDFSPGFVILRHKRTRSCLLYTIICNDQFVYFSAPRAVAVDDAPCGNTLDEII